MIKFKHKLGALVYYLKEGKPHSAPICARCYTENAHENWAHTAEQKQLFTPFGLQGIYYSTCHGIFAEEMLFTNQGDLMMSILSL